MTRGSQRAGLGAGRDLSGVLTEALFSYVRERASSAAIRSVLKGAEEKRPLRSLVDATRWWSQAEVIALFNSAARVLGDPDVALHVGETALARHRRADVGDLLRSTGSVAALLRSAAGALARTSTVTTVRVAEAAEDHAEVRVHTLKGFERHIFMCDFTKGFLSETAGFFGSGLATITEPECQARGGRSCVYRLSWSDTSRPFATRGAAGDPVPERELQSDSDLEDQTETLSGLLDEAYASAKDLLLVDGTRGLLDRIAARAARAVEAPRLVMVVQTPQGTERGVHSHGMSERDRARFSSELLRSDESSFGPDVVLVDIASERHGYGRLAAFAPPNGFAPGARRILAAYAAYAATALDLVSTEERARKSNEASAALLDFSRALARDSTVDEVVTRLAGAVPVVVGSDRSTVMLWDPDEQALTVRAATGHGAEAATVTQTGVERAGYKVDRASTALFEKVLNSHSRDVLVVDLDTEDETIHSILTGTGTACSLIAPLSSSDEFYGIVTANYDESPTDDPRNDDELLTRMASLADHAVTAMQNARLLEQVTHLAWHDSLTGLPNRRLLEDRVNQELVRARRNGESICMFFIDLDRLKQVNDTLGHAAGDELIRHVAQRLVDTVRSQDTVARLGGDEFAVLLPGLADLGDIDTLASRTLDALRRRYNLMGKEVHVSGSIGVAVAPGHGETYDELLSNADAAMYRAKSLGRDTYQLYNVPDGGQRPDVQLEVDLRHAVEREEMTVLYQPIVDMETSEVVGVEALTRWRHPVRGVIDPVTFLSLPAETEVIAGLDTWVVGEACRQIAEWTAEGLTPLGVSVNVSARSLASEGFGEAVESALHAWRVAPAVLELEVSEPSALEADGPARRAVDALVALGVHVAVCDVGAASAASSRIGSLPVSTLKLDRSFVQLVGDDEQTAALVAAIVAVTSRRGIRCVAEGVETQEQARSLLRQGCRYGQGFLFSPPLLAGDVAQMISGLDGRSAR
jgi:diguanylate cyclase (GGDEF)-like protein